MNNYLMLVIIVALLIIFGGFIFYLNYKNFQKMNALKINQQPIIKSDNNNNQQQIEKLIKDFATNNQQNNFEKSNLMAQAKISENNLRNKISEIEKLTNMLNNQKSDLTKSHNKVKEISEKYAILDRQKSRLTVKEIGENLENWILKEYAKHSYSFTNAPLTKTNKTILGTKPDFQFIVNDELDHTQLLKSLLRRNHNVITPAILLVKGMLLI